MIVTLTGFMGCGKSTAGALLAERLGCEFIDLDAYITHKTGSSPAEILTRSGETIFRSVEAEAVKDIITLHEINGQSVVLALGGGTPMTGALRPLIFERSICIWLKAHPDTIERRLQGGSGQRPLFENGDWRALLAQREPVYAKAHLHVITDDSEPAEVADMAFALLQQIA
ncbi:MAG: dephospho-CoA kinase [Bacteroidales bacterium]|nr:dephospho-CoA kinase [Candidatus Cryptobacteroides aphodequi]